MPWFFCRGCVIRRSSFPLLFLITLVIAGCGSKASATPKPSHKQQPHPPTATIEAQSALDPSTVDPTTPIPLATATSAPVIGAAGLPTAVPTPQPTIELQTEPVQLTSATLRPVSVSPGATLTATVQTTGSVGSVEVYLSAGPTGPPPSTFTLTETSPGVWSAAAAAPSTPGEYHYTVGLFAGGKRTLRDDDSWNVKVVGGDSQAGTGPAQAQTLPADIPLAPPFSYGNPVPAVFNAAGHTINGSSVTSTSRSDIAPSVVSQWYEVHLPRAGWSVEPSTIPAPAATSFTMVGTSGNRAVVVQYAGYTVQVFYGSFG